MVQAVVENILGCRVCLSLDATNQLETHVDKIKSILTSDGVCFVQLQNIPASLGPGKTMEAIVNAIGGEPHEHDAEGTCLWHIKDMTDEIPSGTTVVARSHTSKEFELHTDCSYEDPAPRYIGMQVVEIDRYGGGISRLLCCSSVFSRLPQEAIEILAGSDFNIEVPPEFRKDHNNSVKAPIILDTQQCLMRFRQDIVTEDSLGEKQKWAFGLLRNALENNPDEIQFNLPKDSVLLLDNARFLHGRTTIFDKTRHLVRTRFNLKTQIFTH